MGARLRRRARPGMARQSRHGGGEGSTRPRAAGGSDSYPGCGGGFGAPADSASPRPRPAVPERIGIFGGSFDPVHRGHLFAARAARDAFGLDRVLFVPAARPPHKLGRALAPAADRVAMLALALEGEPDFAIEGCELGRAGPSYTIDTVRELERRFAARAPELFLVLGSDNLPGLPDWYEVEELLARVQPIVVHREGDPAEHLRALAGRLSPPALQRLERGFLRLPAFEAAASELRARLARGADVGELLTPAVRDYVREHGLYRA